MKNLAKGQGIYAMEEGEAPPPFEERSYPPLSRGGTDFAKG